MAFSKVGEYLSGPRFPHRAVGRQFADVCKDAQERERPPCQDLSRVELIHNDIPIFLLAASKLKTLELADSVTAGVKGLDGISC